MYLSHQGRKGHSRDKFCQASAVESRTLDLEVNEGARRTPGMKLRLGKGRGLWGMILELAIVLSHKSAGERHKGV